MQKKSNQQNAQMNPMASPWQHIDAQSAIYILTGRLTAPSFFPRWAERQADQQAAEDVAGI